MRLVHREVSTVYPASASGRGRVLVLSGADQFVRPRHVPVLLFYKAREDGIQVVPTNELKRAVCELLVHFYPTAGRMRRREDGKLELVCNDAGVEFVEAVVSGRICDFVDFQPTPLFTQLLDPAPSVVGDAVFSCPITFIQVTRFACGGASVVVSINHACTDGVSVNMFITSLSEIARGKEVSVAPVHDRGMLKARKPCDPTFQPDELRAVPDVAVALPQGDTTMWPAERMFVFSPAQVERIKSMGVCEAGQAHSTFETMNAHVWRCITKARGLAADKKTKFLTTLDARNRLPHIPQAYFGNCICFVSAVACAGDIVNKPLSFAAACIRAAIAGFTSDYMDSVLAFAEAHRSPLAMNVNAGDAAGHDVCAASWVRMGFMQADMGSGKPVFASPGNNPFDGSVLMLPSHKGDGYINIFVALKPPHMDMLIADPHFLPMSLA